MPAVAKIDTFSNEDFSLIVANSSSLLEVSKKLGYTSHSGDNGVRIRKRIDALGLSTEHFSLTNKRPIKRCPENIFIQDSTADQKTLRKYYMAGSYTPYVCSICGLEPFW